MKIQSQPTNKNTLTRHAARLVLKRAPALNFFSQEVTLPAMQGGVATFQTRLDRVPWPGESLDREDLQITFKVDEDVKNYMEIWNWMIGIYYPDSHDQYAALSNKSRSERMSGEGVFSDLTVIVYSSASQPNIEFRFQDAFPVALSSLRFTTTDDTVVPMDASVAFRYRHFTVHSARDGSAL